MNSEIIKKYVAINYYLLRKKDIIKLSLLIIREFEKIVKKENSYNTRVGLTL